MKNKPPKTKFILNKFLLNCLNNMKKKQEVLMDKYNFGKENNKFLMFPEKNLFYMYNDKTKKVFFEAKIQIIGTYSNKSTTWRWGWSNRFVLHNMKKTSLKILNFGKINKINVLVKPKIKDDNLGYIFTSIGMKLSNGKGYYIIPGTNTYPDIFLIFTNVKKINEDYDKLIKLNKNIKLKISKKNKNLLQLYNNKPKISKKNKTIQTKKTQKKTKKKIKTKK